MLIDKKGGKWSWCFKKWYHVLSWFLVVVIPLENVATILGKIPQCASSKSARINILEIFRPLQYTFIMADSFLKYSAKIVASGERLEE